MIQKTKKFYPQFTQIGKYRLHGLVMVLMLLISLESYGDTLTLAQCQRLARENFSVMRQNPMYKEIFNINSKKLKSHFYPTLDIQGQASYQSDVVELPFSIPGADIPELPHEHAQAYLELRQSIYDGGITKTRKELEVQNLSIHQTEVAVSLQTLQTQVNATYFNRLVLQQSAQVLHNTLDLLQEKKKILKASLQEGIVLESDVLKLEAEMIKLEQSIDENMAQQSALGKILGILINQEIDSTTVLQTPDAHTFSSNVPIDRPELTLLSLQQKKLEVSQQLSARQKAPKISAFARGGVGYPNPYNFFDDDASPFYMVGARFTWNILDWQQTKREQEVLGIQHNILQTRHENTTRQIQLELVKKQADIERLEKTLEKDEQLVQVQERVLDLASTQLDNGVISSADFLEELHARQSASLNHELHKIKLIKAQYDYLLTQGQIFNEQP